MNYFQKTITDTLDEFEGNAETGLTDKQVIKNQERFGKNEFSKADRKSVFKKIFDAMSEPMILILLAAAIITISINVYKLINGLHAEFEESIGILIAIILSSGIEVIMEGRSEKAFDTLNSISEDVKVKALRNGVIQYINKREVTVGEIIKIETGDKVPADARLIDTIGLKVDESMLTGESVEVDKDHNIVIESPKASLAERTNMIYAGTFVIYGQGTAVVTAVGDGTEMGNIASELKKSLKKSTPLQEKLGKLSKIISLVGISIAAVIFIFEVIKLYLNGNISFEAVEKVFVTDIALIVAAVPEGLPTIVAMTLALNVIKMAKTNALVRKLVACETIGCVNVICSDKTGTLTKNKMTVIDIWNNGEMIKPRDLKSGFMIENFTVNSTADINIYGDKVKFLGNPTECALLKAFSETADRDNNKYKYLPDDAQKEVCVTSIPDEKESLNYKDIRNSANVIFQYPFSSDKKSMTTLLNGNSIYRAYTKGSPEKIISLCNRIIVDDKVIGFTDELKNKVNNEIEKLQKEAKRILAFSHGDMEKSKYKLDNVDFTEIQNKIEANMIFDGFVSIADPLRDDIFDAVKKCRESGIDIKILTGDNVITASAIARELNLIDEDSLVLEASDIDEMSDAELNEKIDKIRVIARSKPLTKMRVVKMLKAKENVVAVTGDGINDAPALKNADVGIAMGITGTEVSKEASDIILMDDSFSTIVKAVEWGRGIYENFQRFIQFQLTVNLAAVLIVLICEICGFGTPFTTIQLLWVNLIMDGPPAISLGLEPLREHLMKQEPVKRNASIITKRMLSRIVLNGVFTVIAMMLLIKYNILNGSSSQKSSIIFTTFVIIQLFNAFNSRELKNKSIFIGFFKNKAMVLIIGLTFLLQVVITQFGGDLFRTSRLSFAMWIKIIAYSFTIVLFSEAVKFVKRILEKKVENEIV